MHAPTCVAVSIILMEMEFVFEWMKDDGDGDTYDNHLKRTVLSM